MALVMGIVNVTPDSFSDGGKYCRPEEAVRRVKNLISEGADIIDIGAESTRPGSVPITWEEEWSRLEPVLEGLSPYMQTGFEGSVPISIDTYHPETARLAVKRGVRIINCVYAEPIGEMLDILAENQQIELVMPVSAWGQTLQESGMASRIYIDPMIGFGTSRQEDLDLLRSVPELAKKARVLVGASRKRLVKKLTGEKVTGKNLGGNLGIAVWAALNGASAVRVHDVRETVQALKVIEAIENDGLRR
jgi:dihydropteroate synthase